MPFTVAHAAAVLPLHTLTRRRTDLSAIILGSMVPDLAYFYHLHPRGGQLGHSIIGLLTFCLPAGLACYFVFHWIVKRPAAMLLPEAHRRRLEASINNDREKISSNRLLSVGLSLVIGALTHVIWDAFTHRQGWFVQAIPILQSTAFDLGNRIVPVYELLQHGGGVVGVCLLAFWYRRWFTSQIDNQPCASPAIPRHWRRAFTTLILGLSAAFGLTFGYLSSHYPPHPSHPFRLFAARAAVSTMTAFVVLLLVFSLWSMCLLRYPTGRRGTN